MADIDPLMLAAQMVIAAIEDDCIHPDDRHRIAATAIRTAVEELQYRLFLSGSDPVVVDARALFTLANKLEGAQ